MSRTRPVQLVSILPLTEARGRWPAPLSGLPLAIVVCCEGWRHLAYSLKIHRGHSGVGRTISEGTSVGGGQERKEGAWVPLYWSWPGQGAGEDPHCQAAEEGQGFSRKPQEDAAGSAGCLGNERNSSLDSILPSQVTFVVGSAGDPELDLAHPA